MTTALETGLSPTRAVLPNGVVVLAQPNATAPAVAINATFLAGSVDDPPQLPGRAYLAAKTIDRGTWTRSAAMIAELLDEWGVGLRVIASRYTITLSCLCLVEDFDEVLALVADIAQNPAFPDCEVDKRRIDAITSVLQDEDSTAVCSGDALLMMLYGAEHPCGRSLKGTPGTLEAITGTDLARFRTECLVPSALRLVVVGAVPAGRAIESAARCLEGWRGAPAGARIVPRPSAVRRSIRFLARPGKAQTDIAYGFATVSRLDPRYYALWLMNNILGQFGLGGRLGDNIRERQGMAYYAYSMLDATPAEAPLVIRAGVDPRNVHRTLEAIDAEVRSLANEGPTPDEFVANRESLIGSIPRMLETNEGIADFLQTVEQFGLGPDFDRRLPSFLSQVTLDDVREAARSVLDPDRAAIAIAGPGEEDLGIAGREIVPEAS